MCGNIFKRKDKCFTCPVKDDLSVCLQQKDILNDEITTLKYDIAQVKEDLLIANSTVNGLHAELVPLRVYQVGTTEEKLLAILENIAPTPELWYRLQNLLNNRMKADVSIVTVDLNAYREWYGPLQASIVKHKYTINVRDRAYWTFATKGDAQIAIKSLWVLFLRYVPEHFDCDDFATTFAALLNLVYGVNSCAYVESEWKSGGEFLAHAWNVLWVPGEPIKIEPQTSTIMKWEELVPKPYRTTNIRTYIR